MATPLQGIVIKNNFGPTQDEFDTLMTYINDSLKDPIALTLNIQTIQEQLKDVTADLSDLKTTVSQISDVASDKPLINASQTLEQTTAINGAVAEIRDNLLSLDKVTTVKINSNDIDEATGNMNTFTATVTNANNVVEKLKYTLTDLGDEEKLVYSEPKIQSVTDNSTASEAKQLQTEENALVDRENGLLADAISLNKEDLDLIQQIEVADTNGNIPLKEKLTLLEQAKDFEVTAAENSLSNASDEAQSQLLSAIIEKKEDIATTNAQIEGQEDATNAKIQTTIELYQRAATVKIAAMQSTYGDAIDTDNLTAVQADIDAIGTSGVSKMADLRNMFQDCNASLSELQANAKETASAMSDAEGSTNGFSNALGMVSKMAPMMAVAAGVMGVVTAIKSGVSSAIEMNSTLNLTGAYEG